LKTIEDYAEKYREAEKVRIGVDIPVPLKDRCKQAAESLGLGYTEFVTIALEKACDETEGLKKKTKK
jgi:predicted DNA binding CopG/RHH family protein